MSTEASRSVNPAWGAWLLQQIRRREINQVEFAERVGVKPATVSRWVNGRVPRGSYLDSISDALMLDFDTVATKAGIRPSIQEMPASEREARAAELVRRIDWDQGDIALRMVMANLEELAETFRKERNADDSGRDSALEPRQT
jgi:transcriptional regulator with XRE-family HTH domain